MTDRAGTVTPIVRPACGSVTGRRGWRSPPRRSAARRGPGPPTARARARPGRRRGREQRSSRLRRPTRTTSAVASRTSPARTGAEEADLGVAGEQPLVAVHDDRDLGGDVAEQAQRVGAVDQGAAVVGVRVGHVAAVGDGQAERGGRSAVMLRAPSPGRGRGPGSWRPRRASSPGRRPCRRRGRRPSPGRSAGRRRPAAAGDSPIASRNAAASSRVLRRCASFCVTTWETRTASARAARALRDQVRHGRPGRRGWSPAISR